MGSLVLSDDELLAFAGGAQTLQGIGLSTRDLFRLAACREVVGALEPRFIVPDGWADPFAKQVAADLAIYKLLRKRGFDPKVDHEIVASYKQAHELLGMARDGKFSFGLASRRRVFSAAPIPTESDGWLNWRSIFRRGIE